MDRDSDHLEDERPPDTGQAKASTPMVDRLMKSIAIGINSAIIPGETTQADLLSAMFTVLYRMLEAAKPADDPEDEAKNAHEIGRVLQDMLIQFGGGGRVQ